MSRLAEEFKAVWPILDSVTEGAVAIAGGYGLLLQELHFRKMEADGEATYLVPFRDWKDNEPRATRDMDFLLHLEVIASEEKQVAIAKGLEAISYTSKPAGDRFWRYKKEGPDREDDILVEFLSERPAKGSKAHRFDGYRVKGPKHTDPGVHGRPTPESALWFRHTVNFHVDGLEVRTPNAASWLCMKLHAADDMRNEYLQASGNPEASAPVEKKFLKHCGDVYRIVAMLDRAGAAGAEAVAKGLAETPSFERAQFILRNHFLPADALLSQNWRQNWRLGQLDEMNAYLRALFAIAKN